MGEGRRDEQNFCEIFLINGEVSEAWRKTSRNAERVDKVEVGQAVGETRPDPVVEPPVHDKTFEAGREGGRVAVEGDLER